MKEPNHAKAEEIPSHTKLDQATGCDSSFFL